MSRLFWLAYRLLTIVLRGLHCAAQVLRLSALGDQLGVLSLGTMSGLTAGSNVVDIRKAYRKACRPAALAGLPPHCFPAFRRCSPSPF